MFNSATLLMAASIIIDTIFKSWKTFFSNSLFPLVKKFWASSKSSCKLLNPFFMLLLFSVSCLMFFAPVAKLWSSTSTAFFMFFSFFRFFDYHTYWMGLSDSLQKIACYKKFMNVSLLFNSIVNMQTECYALVCTIVINLSNSKFDSIT